MILTTTAQPPIWTNQAPHEIALDAFQHFQWSVFPLDAEKKPPKTGELHPDGQPKRLGWKRLQSRRASANEILYWQKTYMPSAWALITGAISNIVLLDFDGEAGQETRIRLGLTHPHVQTGSGGHHMYFRHPGWTVPTLNSKTSRELGNLWPGLDIRADGGYAAFCGRNTSGPYRWLRTPEPEELSILPELLLAYLGLLMSPERSSLAVTGVTKTAPTSGVVNTAPTSSVVNAASTSFVHTDVAPTSGVVNTAPTQALLAQALRLVEEEGKGRNDIGFWLACQVRDNGYTLAVAREVLHEYVKRVPNVNTKGLTEAYRLEEAFASVSSAFSREPRAARSTTAPAPSDSAETASAAGIQPGKFSRRHFLEREKQASGHMQDDAHTWVPSGSLPEIFIHFDQLCATVDQAIAAIMQQEQEEQSLFLQSARLVRVGRNALGRPLILTMGVTEVKEVLTHAAAFFRLRKVPGQEETQEYEKVPASPPKELAEQILARQTQEPYLPFPMLAALIEAPALRPDGSILDQPGYDAATQLYYAPLAGMEDCHVPLNPSEKERSEALALLLSAIGEFPYVSDADRANALALLLTPLLRPAIKRHVPLALIDAPKQGTGKGLLSDVVSILATGKCASILTLSHSDEELQKSITALLIEGATIITLDNITGTLQSRHLDAALTSDMWRGRILGVSKMTEVPQRATWLATGNNIKLGGDLARRCYRIRLDAKVSRPFMRKDFTHNDLVEWVFEQRAHLVGALLTLARAWYAAGSPQDEHLPSLGTFSGWVKLVGGILEYAGVHGFLSNLEKLYEDIDDDNTQWEAFLYAWQHLFGQEWMPLSQVVREITSATTAEAGEENSDNSLSEMLPEALSIALKEKPHSFIVRLGKALEKVVDTCFGVENLHLEKSHNTHKKTSLWRVFAGGAGGAGGDSSHTQKAFCDPQNHPWEERKQSEIEANNPPHSPHPPQSENGQSTLPLMGEDTHLIATPEDTELQDDGIPYIIVDEPDTLDEEYEDDDDEDGDTELWPYCSVCNKYVTYRDGHGEVVCSMHGKGYLDFI